MAAPPIAFNPKTFTPVAKTATSAPIPPPGMMPTTSPDDDLFEAPADVTAEGAPYWTQRPETKKVPLTVTMANGTPASAYVNHGDSTTVNVQQPASYNAPMAAHEVDHTWQNSRNPDFVDNLRAQDSKDGVHPEDYDYGGVAGLASRHPDLGYLNAEQQASIVGDLTKENMMLHPGMSRQELQQWDEKKAALERPIQQMQRIPPKPPPSLASSADTWLQSEHPKVAAFLEKKEGTAARPIEFLRDMLSPPPVPPASMPQPEAPSVALGYANPSQYVRGNEDVVTVPVPAPRPPKRKSSH